jgi:hypothetical protein
MLLGICRKWREIALATPVLWRAMLLECTCDTGEEIEMVKTWLSRSGSYPLSIQTHKYSYTEAETLEAILPHRARWEHVNFHLLLSQVPAIEGPLPFLRALEIRISSDDVPLSPIAFHDVPRLTAATLWDFEYPAAFLPWSQLTSLTLIAKFPEECTPVLANATSLVYCELVLCGDHIPESDIVLSRLESLVVIHFGNEDWGRAAGYLLCFIAPALRRLQVPDTFLAPDPISSLATFISQSGCTLQEVCITGERSISKKAYREAFPSIPTVSFNRMLTDWYCREADEIRRRGTQSMADFEDSES